MSGIDVLGSALSLLCRVGRGVVRAGYLISSIRSVSVCQWVCSGVFKAIHSLLQRRHRMTADSRLWHWAAVPPAPRARLGGCECTISAGTGRPRDNSCDYLMQCSSCHAARIDPLPNPPWSHGSIMLGLATMSPIRCGGDRPGPSRPASTAFRRRSHSAWTTSFQSPGGRRPLSADGSSRPGFWWRTTGAAQARRARPPGPCVHRGLRYTPAQRKQRRGASTEAEL